MEENSLPAIPPEIPEGGWHQLAIWMRPFWILQPTPLLPDRHRKSWKIMNYSFKALSCGVVYWHNWGNSGGGPSSGKISKVHDNQTVYSIWNSGTVLLPVTILRTALIASFTLMPGNVKDTGDPTEQQANSNFPVTKFSSNFYYHPIHHSVFRNVSVPSHWRGSLSPKN